MLEPSFDKPWRLKVQGFGVGFWEVVLHGFMVIGFRFRVSGRDGVSWPRI